MRPIRFPFLPWFAAILFAAPALPAQTELAPWGLITGLRTHGERVGFEAGLRVLLPDGSGFRGPVKYRQQPRATATDSTREVVSRIGDVPFRLTVTEAGPGTATVDLEWTPQPGSQDEITFCFELPADEFPRGEVTVTGHGHGETRPVRASLRPGPSQPGRNLLHTQGTRFEVRGGAAALDVAWEVPLEVRLRCEPSDFPTRLNDPQVEQHYVARALPGSEGHQLHVVLPRPGPDTSPPHRLRLTLNARSRPDPRPVRIRVDPTRLGEAFDGVGGNFRLQFPATDAAVTAYNLDHLRLAWGRVDLPWRDWDPDEAGSALDGARSNGPAPRVHAAMDMARTLSRRGLAMIVSVWTPPDWAKSTAPEPPGARGDALDPARLPRIVRSLAEAVVFLEERYGVKTALFSFNEPETGVDIRQTPEEHADFMEAMGAELARRGLSTRMLLGDTAHGTPAALRFLGPSLARPAVRRVAGAIGFHTWRGCTAGTLRAWRAAARDLQVPLLVTEGGPDAHLHEYPSVRLEPWFQLQEAELYLRVCAEAQPATIMEWQLNTDYSVLAGGGVYGESGPLRPTQRFWNLKQLGATPPGARALPVTSSSPRVTAAAFGAPGSGAVTVHLANPLGPRSVELEGLPREIRSLRVWVTDAGRGMEELAPAPARHGRARVPLPAASFLTVQGAP